MFADNPTPRVRDSNSGFTLVELLVVIAIIGILIGMLLPAVQATREAARRTKCSNNLKQLALGLHNYHDARNIFPPAGFYTSSTLSWNTAILPFIEQGNLFEQVDHAGPYSSVANRRVALNRIEVFLCPSSRTDKSVLFSQFNNSGDRIDGKDTYTAHYQGILGPVGVSPASGKDYPVLNVGSHGGFATGGTMLHDRGVAIAEIHDGTSNTYLLGELSWEGSGVYRNWTRGTNVLEPSRPSAAAKNISFAFGLFGYKVFGFEYNNASFGSMHHGGAQFAYADGSVHFVPETLNIGIYKSMASRAEGEVVALSE